MRRSPLLAALLLAAACTAPAAEEGAAAAGEGSPTVRPELQGAEDGVLVIGDSLTNGARLFGDLGDRLDAAGFDELEILAEDGVGLDWAIEQLDGMAEVPEIVVVELGTNPSARTDGFAELVETVVATLHQRGAEQIAWLTPVHARDDRYADKTEILAGTDGITVVADWASRVRADPRRLAADGLHPVEAGYAELAEFLVDTAAELASS